MAVIELPPNYKQLLDEVERLENVIDDFAGSQDFAGALTWRRAESALRHAKAQLAEVKAEWDNLKEGKTGG